ncbi:MAG: DUF4190 domain-containing protein [Acidobacteriota bacterium]
MKKCPTCDKTYEDSMRFCQTDGSPLVEEAEVVDPYKTMVAGKDDLAAALQSINRQSEPEAVKAPAEDEEVLQIPEASDPMKTQFVSEAELRREMEANRASDEPVMEIPPASATPTPPAFIDPDLNPVTVAPPAAFVEPEEPPTVTAPSYSSGASTPLPTSPSNMMTTPPIPSPFSSPGANASDVSPMVPQFREPELEPKPEAEPELVSEPAVVPVSSKPFEPAVPSSPFASDASSNPFNEPPVIQSSASTPQDQQMAQTDWTPPPAGGAGYQQGGKPPAAAGGQSSTLSIVSLVCGILGMTLCCGTFIVPLIGLILGFMARGKTKSDPTHYGGAGLAMGGIITGALGLVGGVIVWIVYIFYFAAIMSQMR